jgi:hypothetical protein
MGKNKKSPQLGSYGLYQYTNRLRSRLMATFLRWFEGVLPRNSNKYRIVIVGKRLSVPFSNVKKMFENC